MPANTPLQATRWGAAILFSTAKLSARLSGNVMHLR